MALRLIEVFLPSAYSAQLEDSLSKDGVVAHWTAQLSEQRILARVLVRVEDSEAFLDRLESTFAGTDFRAVLLPVEATLPRLEPQKKEPPPVTPAVTEEAKTEEAPAARISREELYQQVNEGAQLTRTFVVLMALSAVVAAVGIASDSVTVVIGAMVIAPMLGPNVALSVATTLADADLARSAAKTNLAGVLVALAVAIPMGLLLKVNPDAGEIRSLLHVQLKDVVLALASGSAGVLSITTAAPAAVIGVMVAVALIPPLVTVGLLVGAGHLRLAMPALLLFVANVICINLAGVVTLVAQDVRPRIWWEEDRAKKAVRIAIALWVFLLLILIAVILAVQHGL
jgi:uncharacterized hydrophobic protein (TIGR00341 family)